MNDNMSYDREKKELMVCCTQCGHPEIISCSKEQYDDLVMRKRLIQDIFPEQPADIREMFLTGWCGICYDLNLTQIPRIEIEHLNQKCKDIFGDFLSDEFYIGNEEDIIEFITEMEWYDGIDCEDMSEPLGKFREEVKKVLDKLNEDEPVTCDMCGWEGTESELKYEWVDEINDHVFSCPKCGRGF